MGINLFKCFGGYSFPFFFLVFECCKCLFMQVGQFLNLIVLFFLYTEAKMSSYCTNSH